MKVLWVKIRETVGAVKLAADGKGEKRGKSQGEERSGGGGLFSMANRGLCTDREQNGLSYRGCSCRWWSRGG